MIPFYGVFFNLSLCGALDAESTVVNHRKLQLSVQGREADLIKSLVKSPPLLGHSHGFVAPADSNIRD